MATYYRYKRPITNTGAIHYTAKTVAQWQEEEDEAPFLAFQDKSGDIHDYSEFISEISIVHNDVDGDDAGRSKTRGARMTRAYLGNKHTLNIKMVNRLPQNVARKIFALIRTDYDKPSFYAWYQSPCANEAHTSKEFYCSTINYGAQRYDRKTGTTYFDGMNFNLIEM